MLGYGVDYDIVSGKTGRNLNVDYVRSDNSESKKVGQGDLPTLDSEVGELLVARLWEQPSLKQD